MIKGQDITTLMTINDTTSGRISVWVMVIMVLLIRIIYLAVLMHYEQYRYMKIITIKNRLEDALAREGTASSGEAEHGTKTQIRAMRVTAAVNDDKEYREAMELFEGLKQKKGW